MSDYSEYQRAVERRVQRDASFRRQLTQALQPGLEHLAEQLLRHVLTQLGKVVTDYLIDRLRDWAARWLGGR